MKLKLKPLSLVAGMALAANMGLAQAAELDKTAEMPEIFGAVSTHEATLMTGNEMAATKGEWYPPAPSGYYVSKVKSKRRGKRVKVVYRKYDGRGSLVYKSWRHTSDSRTWKHR